MNRMHLACWASLGVAVATGCSDKNDSDKEDASSPVVVDGSTEERDGSARDEDGGALDASSDAGAADASGDAELDSSADGALSDGGGIDGALSPDASTGGGALDAAADGGGQDAAGDAASLGDGSVADGASDGGAGSDSGNSQPCAADNGGIQLPAGFCATRYAENIPGARHLVVTPAGDLFVATAPLIGGSTAFVSLRDPNGDGVAEVRETVSGTPGNGIDWRNGYLYFGTHSQILRWALPSGQLRPSAAPEVIVRDLPATPDHYAKSVVVIGDELFVNIGSATNSCQRNNRAVGSPGIDPCTERETRGGIWRFSASRTNQRQSDGVRYAAGTRNANALATDKRSDKLYAALNGRDQLNENWPDLFTPADDVRLPAEGILLIHENDDYGWPYCYFDADANKYFLAPEYGGDGETVGRCTGLTPPVGTLPAHWAPLGMAFYHGDMFPAHYRNGAFIANHGSRFAPNAQTPMPGYNVVFVPFANSVPSGPYERFAEGFAGPDRPLPDRAEHRPVGVAVGPDGAMFVSDDVGGVVWRIAYRGP